MTSVAPRHIVITGASAGLGRALALAYARPGLVIGLVGRNVERLEACAELCRKQGATAVVGAVDVRNAPDMLAWLDQFDDRHPVDLLIANAGVASTIATASGWEDLERTAHIVNTNFYGSMHAVLPVAARMRARRSGQIALIASIAALRGMAISPAYCASKSALKAYGESVRPLLKRHGVRLSVVFPGFVETSMSDAFPGDKPFMWSAAKAARHIQLNLAANRSEIAFPALLAFGTKLLGFLPATLADAILGGLSYSPSEEG
jgi:short-subunit dehydrogenase